MSPFYCLPPPKKNDNNNTHTHTHTPQSFPPPRTVGSLQETAEGLGEHDIKWEADVDQTHDDHDGIASKQPPTSHQLVQQVRPRKFWGVETKIYIISIYFQSFIGDIYRIMI